MKKRVPALVLALALALTVPAWAAQDTPDNFVRSKTYAGQFSDLTPESTFYDNVAALYAYGLSVGKADGTFGLRDQLTVGQVVIFAGRIRSLYRTGDQAPTPPRMRPRPSGTCVISRRRVSSARSWTSPSPPPPPGPRWPMCWQTPFRRRPCRPFTRTW